jgi:hypothetical protein
MEGGERSAAAAGRRGGVADRLQLKEEALTTHRPETG